MHTRPNISFAGGVMLTWAIMCWGYDVAFAAFGGLLKVSLHGGNSADEQAVAIALLVALFLDTVFLLVWGTGALRGARGNMLYGVLRMLWICYAFTRAGEMIPLIGYPTTDDKWFTGFVIMLLGVVLNLPMVLFHLRMLARGPAFRAEVAAIFSGPDKTTR